MAGTIVSDTIQNGAGASTSTTNVINGAAKAWVQFAGSTGTIQNSFNVSSITRNSTGNYTLNFTSAMANANYVPIVCTPMYNSGNASVMAQILGTSTGASTLKSTTQLSVAWVVVTGATSFYDPAEYYVVIYA